MKPDFDRDKRDCGALSEVFLKTASRSLCGGTDRRLKFSFFGSLPTLRLRRNIEFGGAVRAKLKAAISTWNASPKL